MKQVFILLTLLVFTQPLVGQEKLKVGIVLYKTEEKVLDTFHPLMTYVANEIGREAEVTLVHEDDLAYYLENGEYDLGIFTVFPYLKEKSDFPDLEVFATHHVNGSDHFYGSILTQKKSRYKDLSDLKGKKFLFVKPTSTSGFKYPKGIFTEHSLDIDHGFFEYEFAGGHEEAIQALAEGRVDGIAVDETRFKKVKGTEKTDFNELERFKVPYHAYVFSPKTDTGIRAQLTEVFAKAHRDPAAKKLWDNPLNITRWELKNDEYYNLIRRYLRIIRIQPEVTIHVTATETALRQLEELGDVTTVMESRIRRLLAESKRFSNKITHVPEYVMEVGIAYTGKQFSYQVQINETFVTDGESPPDSLNLVIPHIASRALLKTSRITTDLLYNGSEWFCTYGLNDGINLEHYDFSFKDETGRKVSIWKKDIDRIDDLNIFFDDDRSFFKGAQLEIIFKDEIKTFDEEEDVTSISTYNIFSRSFWASNYWDKLGLIGGFIVAIISGIIGKVVADRKKKRFKNILDQTNNLITDYMDGHYKLEAKLIDQKERISQAFEDGHVNENQFLILKHRLDDIQNILDVHQQGDVQLSEGSVDEISAIVKDGKVTEKEFNRILNILKKSNSLN